MVSTSILPMLRSFSWSFYKFRSTRVFTCCSPLFLLLVFAIVMVLFIVWSTEFTYVPRLCMITFCCNYKPFCQYTYIATYVCTYIHKYVPKFVCMYVCVYIFDIFESFVSFTYDITFLLLL